MDLRVQAAVPLVQKWIALFCQGLETGSNLNIDEDTTIKREQFPEYDERLEKLASNAKSQLPMPLQTLLSALEDVKIDIAKINIKHKTNYENVWQSKLETLVTYTCKSADTCTKRIQESIDKSFKNYDCSILKKKRNAITIKFPCQESPNTVQAYYENAKQLLKKAQDLYEQNLLQVSEVVPVEVPDPSDASVVRAEKAVKASVRVRDRLRELATGPLAELFEPEVLEEKQPLEEQAIQKKCPIVQDQKGSIEIISSLQAFLRYIHTTMHAIRFQEESFINQSIEVCTEGISKANTKLIVEPLGPCKVPEHFSKGDISLQTEIKFLLETIQVDRNSLNIVLRSIKAKCLRIEQQYGMERSADWLITIARWRFQLEEAFDAIHLALRS